MSQDESAANPFPDAVAFMMLNEKTEDGFLRCDLKGFHEDYEYGLKMELKQPLAAGRFKFHGPGALVFRSIGERSDHVLKALGKKLGLTPPATFKSDVSFDDLNTLDGDAADMKAPIEFKGFLDGGSTELYVELYMEKGLVVVRPRHGGEAAVLAAFGAA